MNLNQTSKMKLSGKLSTALRLPPRQCSDLDCKLDNTGLEPHRQADKQVRHGSDSDSMLGTRN